MARRSKENAIDWVSAREKYEQHGQSARSIAREIGCQVSTVCRKIDAEEWVAAGVRRAQKGEPGSPASDGFLYVIGFRNREHDFYKIGIATNVRVRLLTLQTGMPFELKVCASYFVENMMHEENTLHAMFAEKRIRGEWFELNQGDLELIAKRSLLA